MLPQGCMNCGWPAANWLGWELSQLETYRSNFQCPIIGPKSPIIAIQVSNAQHCCCLENIVVGWMKILLQRQLGTAQRLDATDDSVTFLCTAGDELELRQTMSP